MKTKLASDPSALSGRVIAWAVHLFTASGAVLALLAIDAIQDGEWHLALVWLLVALVIDGIDGTLARAAKVKERLPLIDGAALDLVIDYLNYVLVPTLLIWRAGFFPNGLAIPLCASILVSSLYVFARRDMKTEDGYFRGFPALWNVVATYFVILNPGGQLATVVVLVLVVLTFAPVYVAHPFRVQDAKFIGPPLAIIWAVSTGYLLLTAPDLPHQQLALLTSLVSLAGLTFLGALRSIRRPGK